MESKCHPEYPHMAKGMCNKCYQKQYRKNNSIRLKELNKQWRENNRDRSNFTRKEWAKNNSDKVKIIKQKYVSRNLSLYRAQCAKRHVQKLLRTPKWADLKAIKEFYMRCPKGMEIDHIIPLQGKDISGLHVLENLQYLTPKKNRSKGNRFTQL